MHPELANLLGQLSFSAAVQDWLRYGYLLLLVVIGFSVIIFVHELGHFLAAKWMGVRVDRFAIGFFYRVCGYRRGEGFTFGPRPSYKPEELVAKGYGETDYCLNALPFGGYVKMLGEDDIQVNDETGEVTRSNDPRAFTNKPVGRRMVVVSAGVVFNAAFAILLYATGFLAFGKNMLAPVLGLIEPSSPAAAAGLLPGDRVLAINGTPVHSFDDVFMGSVLSREPLHLTVERGGKVLPKELVFEPPPRRSGESPAIPFAPMTSTVVDGDIVAAPDAQGLQPGDRVVQVNGQPVESAWQIVVAFQACRGAPVEFSIARPNPEHPDRPEALLLQQKPSLMFYPSGGSDAGKTAQGERQSLLGMLRRAVVLQAVPGGPAEQAGFKSGDVIVQWGTVANPLGADITQSTEANDGVPIPVVVERGGELVTLTVTPRRAFSLVGSAPARVQMSFRAEDERPVVADVVADTPAAALGMPRGAELRAVNEREVRNWFDVFEALKAAAGEVVAVRYRSGADEVVGHMRVPSSLVNELNLPPTAKIRSINGEDSVTLASGKKAALPAPFAVQKLLERFSGRTVTVEFMPTMLDTVPQSALFAVRADNTDPWQMRGEYSYVLADYFRPLSENVTAAGNPLRALVMGVDETRLELRKMYRIFQSMFSRSGNVGVKDVAGPIGIVQLAVSQAEAGPAKLLSFLAFLSINLAVLNFLPIPVVDGGLMVLLILEKLRGKPLGLKVQVITTLVGLGLIVLCFVLVTFQDVARLVGGGA